MNKSRWHTAIALLLLVPTVAACSPSGSTREAVAPERTDGNIISTKMVKVPGQSPDIRVYEIYYMSGGAKVAAYVSEPKQPGRYPLLVELHGGFAEPQTYTHYPLPDNASPAQQVASVGSGDKVVVMPEYRGYGDSEGTVGDLLDATVDTKNAISAVVSMGEVRPNDLYLMGTSLGGGVALMLASERSDVKSVVAVSPFVGYDAMIDWEQAHPQSLSSFQDVSLEWAPVWGKYKPGAKNYTIRSPIDHISTIEAPVLLLQGTGDQNVIWQTVKEFADKMKQEHKTVKLDLYPGGNHGLHDQYRRDAYQEELVWFTRYGLNYGL